MNDQRLAITVRCFAAVRELLGAAELSLEVAAGTTVDGLRQLLAVDHPGLLRLPLAFAVNRDYARADTVLAAGDEVAFIPPISGGSGESEDVPLRAVHGPDRCARSRSRLPPPMPMVRWSRSPAPRATTTKAPRCCRLRYETYPEMAQKVMRALFEATQRQFAITRARVAHRLGEVPVGEASVVVVVSSAHRGPAFEACRYLMDRLKNEVPVWKQEQLRDGAGVRWIGDLPRPPAD